MELKQLLQQVKVDIKAKGTVLVSGVLYHNSKAKGTILCPNLHNISQLPSTREG